MEISQSSNVDKHNFTDSNDIRAYKVKALEDNKIFNQPIIIPHKKINKKYKFSKTRELLS
tara:strand:- start:301 stop:480 length:180 start_codon:yes stop_codon:yes gene_type:complete